VIDLVLRSNDCVPPLDHNLISLLRTRERPHSSAVFAQKRRVVHLVVTEMSVGDQPDLF
jgi:hypothetical protein